MLKGYFLLERSCLVARLAYQTKALKISFYLQPTSVSDYKKLFFFRFYEAINKKQFKDSFWFYKTHKDVDMPKHQIRIIKNIKYSCIALRLPWKTYT